MTPYYKLIIKYGVIISILISVYKLSELMFINKSMSLDTYSFIIAFVSLLISIYFSRELIEVSKKLRPINSPTNKINIEISKRELEVLELLSEGHTNNEISDLLFISLNTTKTHLSNIYSKLGTNNRVQTIKIARDCGIIK